MCLTLPAQIQSVSVNNLLAQVDLAGQVREVKLGFSEKIAIGDWVLINADLAVSKIGAEEAKEINEYLK